VTGRHLITLTRSGHPLAGKWWIEQLGYNLLLHWFVGLSMDTPLWDARIFITSRQRLLASDVAAQFLAAVLSQPRVEALLASEHFSIDRSLIEAWTIPLLSPI
jgi:transposase